ncbi:MAG: rubredoxin [Lautropia sp.]
MAQVVGFEDVRDARVRKTGRSGKNYWRTSFVTPQGDDDPQAYLIENSPDMTIASHFHDVDQFQIFVRGEGSLGRTAVAPISVHFARAFTTYGPIESRGEGLAWMTLRPRRDLGAKMIDTHRETLERNIARKPWQTTIPARFPVPGTASGAGRSAEVLKGDYGLSAIAFVLLPGEIATASDPSASPCQYILVTRGSLIHEGTERPALTVVHVPPTDAAFQLRAGPQGLECLVLDFPDPDAANVASTGAAAAAGASLDAGAAADEVWHCALCGFVYDPAEGLPADGIPAGTPWSAVPEDFRCPDCAATKADFSPL